MGASALHPSHFATLLIFAALSSLALACLTHRTPLERIKYAAWTFIIFVLIAVGIGWAMYPFSH